MGKEVIPNTIMPLEANPKLGKAFRNLLFGFDCMKYMVDKVGSFTTVITYLPEYPSAEDNSEYKATKEDGVSSVGKNCLLMAYCHVGHDCSIGNNVIMANDVHR